MELFAHIVNIVGGNNSVGVPEIKPSKLSVRAKLIETPLYSLKYKPSGNSGLISQVNTPPPSNIGD